MSGHYTVDDLKNLKKTHDTFVGIDSDGCVFDTMSVKQKQFFHGLIVKYWGLEKCERQLRDCAEFVNLYSKNRGINRFPATLLTFELFNEHPEVRAAGLPPVKIAGLKAYCESGLPLGNPSLKEYAAKSTDPEIKRLLDWSLAVNVAIDRDMEPVPPFKWAFEALKLIRKSSNAIVVSQTPEEALVKEWKHHKIEEYVSMIAGQELGTKAQHLALATEGRFPVEKVLMIGDALGDLKAAKTVKCDFYPIVPGKEEESWERFCKEAYGKFLDGTYRGSYADGLIQAFDDALPATPPWKK